MEKKTLKSGYEATSVLHCFFDAVELSIDAWSSPTWRAEETKGRRHKWSWLVCGLDSACNTNRLHRQEVHNTPLLSQKHVNRTLKRGKGRGGGHAGQDCTVSPQNTLAFEVMGVASWLGWTPCLLVIWLRTGEGLWLIMATGLLTYMDCHCTLSKRAFPTHIYQINIQRTIYIYK